MYGESCIKYSGVCKQFLPQLGLSNATSLYTVKHNKISEAEVGNFMHALQLPLYQAFLTERCDITEDILPFLCQYVYPPCTGGNASTAQLITRGKCENMRDVVCSTEWKLVTSLTTSPLNVLPVCENFEESDLDIEYSDSLQDALEPLQCHHQFKEFCGLCLPLCGEFSQYNAETTLQEKYILIFSGASAFVGGILVFIAAITRRNKL